MWLQLRLWFCVILTNVSQCIAGKSPSRLAHCAVLKYHIHLKIESMANSHNCSVDFKLPTLPQFSLEQEGLTCCYARGQKLKKSTHLS